MNDLEIQEKGLAAARAIALAEALLCECDEHGFVFAAIDVSSALDKLKAIKEGL
jgi:hypothetical protein